MHRRSFIFGLGTAYGATAAFPVQAESSPTAPPDGLLAFALDAVEAVLGYGGAGDWPSTARFFTADRWKKYSDVVAASRSVKWVGDNAARSTARAERAVLTAALPGPVWRLAVPTRVETVQSGAVVAAWDPVVHMAVVPVPGNEPARYLLREFLVLPRHTGSD